MDESKRSVTCGTVFTARPILTYLLTSPRLAQHPAAADFVAEATWPDVQGAGPPERLQPTDLIAVDKPSGR